MIISFNQALTKPLKEYIEYRSFRKNLLHKGWKPFIFKDNPNDYDELVCGAGNHPLCFAYWVGDDGIFREIQVYWNQLIPSYSKGSLTTSRIPTIEIVTKEGLNYMQPFSYPKLDK